MNSTPVEVEMAETKPPPPEEALDIPRLEAFLHGRLPGAQGALEAWRFTGGFANLTYLLRFGDREFVLRRPPLGPVAPGSHDMRREHQVLSRLPDAYPLAPRSLLLCEDESVIGAVFAIAERRRGIAITTELPEQYRNRPELNRRIGEMLIDALADLHKVDPAAVGLQDLGRPEGFVGRQLDGWSRRWEAALDRPYPQTQPLLDWLRAGLPRPQAAGLLHNDYKLDNLLVDPVDPARAVAVLDWDMCTRGDPLLDLGYVLNYWVEPGDDPSWMRAAAMPFWHKGFPSRAEAVQRYAARTGFDVSGVRWYLVFAIFKLAVIIQQIFIRYVRGQTTDERFADFGLRVQALMDKAVTAAGISPSGKSDARLAIP
jgi:aminoglycoside phosphotransferase (APT) family kinase protein